MAEVLSVKVPEYQNYLRVFYDAEFTGLRRDAELISIGLISENGSYFYAEFNDFDQTYINEWLKEHVINNLLYNEYEDYYDLNNSPSISEIVTPYNVNMKGSREVVKDALLKWLQNESRYSEKKIQFFTDCYAYDWVLLNDLICEDGLALNLPDFIYYIPIDLCAAMYMNGVDPDINREQYVEEFLPNIARIFPFSSELKHNSLWDAYVIWYCFIKVLNVNRNCRIYEFDKFEDAFKEAERRIKEGDIQLRGERDHPKSENYSFEDGV